MTDIPSSFSAPRWFALLFEAQSIQSYLFATNRLRDAVGGSELLDALTNHQTKGNLLDGVRFKGGKIITDTVVMRSWTGTVRRIKAEHIDQVIEAIEKSASTGKIGDGKIFVFDLEQVIRIRTGETGTDAL